MSVFFISDLHLSQHRPQLVNAFAAFLKGPASNASQLYILGDFFDAWIGDDDDGSCSETVKRYLRDYTRSGVPTFLMHGNRDFLIGNAFAADTGLKLLDDSAIIDLYGRPTLLLHGDTLCTRDSEYLKFRAMVRSQDWQQQILALPLPQRRQMAAELRDKSQSLNAMKAEDIMDVTPSEVERVMEAQQVDLLIHGHTHRPARHQLALPSGKAERIVLGDWQERGWFVQAHPDGELELRSFPID